MVYLAPVPGSRIAYAFAQAGYEVVLRTRKQTTLDKAMGYMKKTLDKAVAKGKMEQAAADEIYARVTPATEIEAVADVDFILETIAEDMKIKKDIFAELDKLCKPGVIFGTNTSSLLDHRDCQRRGASGCRHAFLQSAPVMS